LSDEGIHIHGYSIEVLVINKRIGYRYHGYASGWTGEVSMRNGIVDPLILDEIVRRIVACASPEKIILFGSGARGEMGTNSDIDLLVIKNGEFDAGALTEEIYMQLIGVGQAVDVVVVSATDANRYRDSPYFIVYPALHQGREVYRAGQVST
jgi:predicted nucleotidyltransferase